jgi:hypothetical protein
MRRSQFVSSLLFLVLLAGAPAGAFAAPARTAAKRRAVAAPPATPADTAGTRLLGDWHGALDAGGARLRLVVHLTRRAGGGLAGTLDSPDQGVKGLVIDTVTVNGRELDFELRSIRAAYHGTVAPDGASVRGTWSQGRAVMLELTRGAVTAVRRAQDPVKPCPYDEEEVVVENPAAGVRLAGTFTKPRGSGPFPAALLIGGSGPQNRDEEVFEHRPFLVLADHLTRHGIAVLRLDDRGVGGSTGSLALATLDNFVDDAEAAVRFLAARPDVDRARIGLIGHSEGGLVAPRVGTEMPEIAFVVLLAGPGIPGDSLLYLQGAAIMELMGEPAEMIAWNRRLQRVMFGQVKVAPDSVSLRERLSKVITVALPLLPESRRGQVNLENLEGQVQMMTTRWFRSFVAYDPAPALRRLACPVLAVAGGQDMQVLPKENLSAIGRALSVGGNRDFRTIELPGLNHLFQGGGTGSPAEYGVLPETFAPAALDTITAWLEARVEGKAKGR